MVREDRGVVSRPGRNTLVRHGQIVTNPIEHIDQWKSNIVTKYVDQESGRDDPPLLFWRRDVVTLLSDEKQVLSCVVFER